MPSQKLKVPHETDTARVRRPDRETGAGHPLVHHRLRTQGPPQLLVASLAEQMEIELPERGQEAVRVLGVLNRPLVRDEQPVRLRDRAQRHQRREEPVPVVVQLGPQVVRHHGHPERVRTEGQEGHTAGHRMGAEHPVRIVVRAGEQPFAVTGFEPGEDGSAVGDGGLKNADHGLGALRLGSARFGNPRPDPFFETSETAETFASFAALLPAGF